MDTSISEEETVKSITYADGKWVKGSPNGYSGFEAKHITDEIVAHGFNTSVIIQEKKLIHSQFYAKFVANLPGDILKLVDAVFPLFYLQIGLNDIYASKIPDDRRGVGLIRISQEGNCLKTSWTLLTSDGEWGTLKVPNTVSVEDVVKSARYDDLMKRGIITSFMPNCLQKIFITTEDVHNRREIVIKHAINVLNKTLQSVKTPIAISSICLLAEVVPNKGISMDSLGYGYRVTAGGEAELVYYMLNER